MLSLAGSVFLRILCLVVSKSRLPCALTASVQVEVNRGGVAGAGEAGFDPDAIAQRFRCPFRRAQEGG